MRNIEEFDACAGHVLAKLYRDFPVARMLEPADIVKELGGAVTDGAVRGHTANSFVAYTLQWLVESGYLLMKEGGTASMNRYVLSAKGLEALRAPLPDSLGGGAEKTSIGEKLGNVAIDTVKEAGKEGRTRAIGELIGYVFGGIAKSIGSA